MVEEISDTGYNELWSQVHLTAYCIYDLPDKLRSTARLFADDCILYASGTTADLDILQEDLHLLEEWQNMTPGQLHLIHPSAW